MTRVALGRIRRAHGIRGELRLELYGGDLKTVKSATCIWLQSEQGPAKAIELEAVRPGPGGALLIRVVGVADRTLAETYKGAELLIPSAEMPELEDDEFYYFELEGLQVYDLSETFLGEIVGLFNAGATDVAVVRGPKGEWMFPIIEEMVRSIDDDRVVVDPIEGLIEGGI